MTTIKLLEELEQVLALAEKATAGKLYMDHCYGDRGERYIEIHNEKWEDAIDEYGIKENDAELFVSAVNFIREHGPAIRAAVGGGEAVPVAWLRTLDGKPDWGEDCLYDRAQEIDCGVYPADEGYDCIPLYASIPTTVDVGALKELQTEVHALEVVVSDFSDDMPSRAFGLLSDAAQNIGGKIDSMLAALIGKETE